MAEPRASPGAVLMGALLMAAGGLVALLCGGCTLAVLGGLRGGDPQAGVLLGLGLIFGGIPTVAGVVVFVAGWRVAFPRRDPPPRP